MLIIQIESNVILMIILQNSRHKISNNHLCPSPSKTLQILQQDLLEINAAMSSSLHQHSILPTDLIDNQRYIDHL